MIKNSDLQRCIKILQSGGLLVAPSDTVYGLVCDATNESAVRKLIAVKNRPFGKPISVFCDGFEMIEALVKITPHKKLLEKLLPGPFTVVLPSKHSVSSLLESERKTLGIRFTSYPFIQQLVYQYGKPLTATSANISGRSPHYEPKAFINELSADKKLLIDYVVDVGKLPHNKPSTIVDLTGNSIQLLRKGEIIPISEHSFISPSSQDTKKIAHYVIEKYSKDMKNNPLVFILEGEMGVGKTVFAKGLGEYLGIMDIVSPTYVIYYEYPVKKDNIKMLLHTDLYNIEESEEFSHLGIEDYLTEGTVICIEWGNRIGPLFEKIKEKSKVIVVDMDYQNETHRIISAKEL